MIQFSPKAVCIRVLVFLAATLLFIISVYFYSSLKRSNSVRACVNSTGSDRAEHNLTFFSMFQADEDPPHAFSQIFVLKPLGNSFFVQHDIFRLGIHNTA
jgi:hypothetical protein